VLFWGSVMLSDAGGEFSTKGVCISGRASQEIANESAAEANNFFRLARIAIASLSRAASDLLSSSLIFYSSVKQILFLLKHFFPEGFTIFKQTLGGLERQGGGTTGTDVELGAVCAVGCVIGSVLASSLGATLIVWLFSVGCLGSSCTSQESAIDNAALANNFFRLAKIASASLSRTSGFSSLMTFPP
jgi:hypothetical protein